ncbi:MAG TPA: hypothetical protein VGF67_01370 [Ktedonobacteraceae bacterium]|jgi:hypothetical protein
MPSVVLTTICTVLFLVVAWLLSMQFSLVQPNKHPPPTKEEGDEIRPPENHPPPTRMPLSPESIQRPEWEEHSLPGELRKEGTVGTPPLACVTREIASVSLTGKPLAPCPGLVTSTRVWQIPHPSTLPHVIHAQSRYELEQEYERGMHTYYDETIGAIHFSGMQVMMNTPAEVELAFHVCKRQIRTALRIQGLERAPTLTDIRGITIGREATVAWGQALKEYLEEMCIKADNDTYLLAHYNSQAPRPGQDQFQETIRRIQFMTSAAIYHFQSNIFDTREGAMAFLQRMRAVYQV